MLVETHAHLDYPDFSADLPQVLERSVAAGVTRIITIGTGVESSRRAIALAEEHPMVFAAVGIHPLHASDEPDAAFAEIEKLAVHPRVVAVGEIGLDFHERREKPALPEAISALGAETTEDIRAGLQRQARHRRQIEVFGALLEVACRVGKNVVVHQREAWEETLRILQPHTGRLRGVFHCFGGSLEQAREVLTLGHLVSFTGIVTFKNATTVRATAAALAAGQFLVETDCPYLAPAPHRGKRCEPAHTRLVAEELARVRGESIENIGASTSAAAEDFFRLPAAP